MVQFSPATLDELREAIGEALFAGEPVELVAGGTKRGLGRPLQVPCTLDLSELSGIRDYQPNELVLTAAAATPLAVIEVALASARQMLAFEPPNWARCSASRLETPFGAPSAARSLAICRGRGGLRRGRRATIFLASAASVVAARYSNPAARS